MATPAQAGRVTVRVVCAAHNLAFEKDMLVPKHQTLGWCVNASGLYGLNPHLRTARIGVWGKIMPPETVVQANDRIEVYMPVSKETAARFRSRSKQVMPEVVASAPDLGDNDA